MGTMWIFGIVMLVCLMIAVAIIADLMLRRAPKEHWIDALKNTRLAVKEPNEEKSLQPEVRQVTFGQMWQKGSEFGSGYTEIPELTVPKKEKKQVS